jgi:hypothetical protein
MAGNIFISYRRDDEAGYAQALFQRLEAELGRDRLFLDVEGYIKPGDDFEKVIAERIAECDVLLAIIGPRWLDVRDKHGNRRLDDPLDFVRLEIKSAIEQGKRVIPVLVNNASIPEIQELPDALRTLLGKNVVRLSKERFAADCRSFVGDIRAFLDGPGGDTPRKPPKPLVGIIFLALAALAGWITYALASDAEVSRVPVFILSLLTLVCLSIGGLTLRQSLRGGDSTRNNPPAGGADRSTENSRSENRR